MSSVGMLEKEEQSQLHLFWAKSSQRSPSEDFLSRITSLVSETRCMPARRNLYLTGDPLEEVFSIESGWLFRFSSLPDGRRQILSFHIPGDLVPVTSFYADRSWFSVQTLTPARLSVLPTMGLRRLFEEHSAFRTHLHDLTIMIFRAQEAGLVDLGRRTARERVARLMLGLYVRHDQRGLVINDTLPWPLRQVHIADALGMTPVHVSRILASLREDGLIEIEDGQLTILDHRRLLHAAGMRGRSLKAFERVFTPAT